MFGCGVLRRYGVRVGLTWFRVAVRELGALYGLTGSGAGA